MENFFQVLSWAISGSITEREFSELYLVWTHRVSEVARLTSVAATASSSPSSSSNFSERDLRSLLRGRSESDLDLMLGLLINEHNKQLLASGQVSGKWISLCEQLFFRLDQVTLCACYCVFMFADISFMLSGLMIRPSLLFSLSVSLHPGWPRLSIHRRSPVLSPLSGWP